MEATTAEYSLISFQSRFDGGEGSWVGTFFVASSSDGVGFVGFLCEIESLLRIEWCREEV